MKKFVLAYNPVSGDAMFRKKLDHLVYMFQRYRSILIPYRTTPTNSDFTDFIRATLPDGVIIAGGDGTLSSIVNCILQNKLKLPVAIIPSGTSNDFASCIHINHSDFDTYIDSIINGRTTTIDVGRLGNKYFINVVSAGMLTSVAHDVDRRLKNTLGRSAYYLRGIGELPKFRALDMIIETDGIIKNVRAFFVLIVNSNVVAGLKNISVKAKLDDGKLDLIMLKQCKIPDLVAFTAEIVAGKNIIDNKNVEYIQASSFKLSCIEQVKSDIDGEPGPNLPIEVRAVPTALEIYTK